MLHQICFQKRHLPNIKLTSAYGRCYLFSSLAVFPSQLFKNSDDPIQADRVNLDRWYYSTSESHLGGLKIQDLEQKNLYV